MSLVRSWVRRLFRAGIVSLPCSVRDRLLVHWSETSSEAVKYRLGFPTVQGLLSNMYANGFAPRLIVDVGAYVGDWSRMAARVFPMADIVMIDANLHRKPDLERAQYEIGSRSRYAMALLGPEPRESSTFYELESGSSVLPELTGAQAKPVELPMVPLDSLISSAEQPVLIKLDVQGFELEVLRGAQQLLRKTEVAILETALLPYNENAPLFSEVVAYMSAAGFVVYDFCGQWRRQSDQALFQTDVAFVRVDNALRQAKQFWLPAA